MAPTWISHPKQRIHLLSSTQEDAELTIRQAECDRFWRQLEHEEESEQFASMVAELDSRQAAFDFFWARKDEENDDRWARLAQEADDEKFSFMLPELSLRQASSDLLFDELDLKHVAAKTVDVLVPTSPQVHTNPPFSIAGSPAKGLLRAKALFMNIQPLQASSLLSTAVDLGLSAAGLSSPIPPSRGSPNETAKLRARSGRFRPALA